MSDEANTVAQAALADVFERGRKQGFDEGYAACLADTRNSLDRQAAEHHTSPEPDQVSADTEQFVPADSDKPSHDVPIEKLGLSLRISDLLLDEKIYTIGDISLFHDANNNKRGLAKIRRFGSGSFKELNERLVTHGYPELRRVSFSSSM